MAQTPNQKKPNHSKPPLPKQPNRSNIVTLVVFLAVGIFFAVMMTRTMTATNGVTQTDELVTSEFTQAVEQGRVNTAVYDTGSYTITGTYYPAATAGEDGRVQHRIQCAELRHGKHHGRSSHHRADAGACSL